MGLAGSKSSQEPHAAQELLRQCRLCEHQCGADRCSRSKGICGLGEETHYFKRHVSFSEELELLPSYMVYFAGCNFRCPFCAQAPSAFDDSGESVDPRQLAGQLSDLCDRGIKTINLVGGEPSLHPHTILALAAASPKPLPMVLNTNMYMSPQVLDSLEGVISLYLADFKFGNDDCASRLAKVPRYLEVIARNLKRVAPKSPLIVRHLLLPGHVECCFKPAARWMADHLPQTPFHVMSTYVPGPNISDQDGRLTGLIRSEEIDDAGQYLAKLGLVNYADNQVADS